jgi:hypothetical protein
MWHYGERDAPLGPRSRNSGDHTRRQRMDTGPGIWDARSTRVFVGVFQIFENPASNRDS